LTKKIRKDYNKYMKNNFAKIIMVIISLLALLMRGGQLVFAGKYTL
jgi:hypothetical protein